jgi:uncharacterized membrane protein
MGVPRWRLTGNTAPDMNQEGTKSLADCGQLSRPFGVSEPLTGIMAKPAAATAKPVRDSAPPSMAESIEKVIQAENNALRPTTLSEAITDAIGGFAGTLPFVAVQIAACAGWVIVNTGQIPGIGAFDPFPYPLLSTITSLEAVLLAAFVLMKQNRMSTVADRRAHLDLQVNLLTERESTRVIQMLERLSSQFGVEQHHDAESRELSNHIAVDQLVEELDRRMPDASSSRSTNEASARTQERTKARNSATRHGTRRKPRQTS